MMKWLDKDKCISISRFTPCEVKSFKLLAPSDELLRYYKETHDVEFFSQEYFKYLNKANPKKVYDYLNGHILICYEKSSDFCHRHLVRKWFNDNNLKCQEINFGGDIWNGI